MPSFASPCSRSMPASSPSSAEHARDICSRTRSRAASAFTSSSPSISRSMSSARAVMTRRAWLPSPAMSVMTLCSLGLRMTSSRRRSAGFRRGPTMARRSRCSRRSSVYVSRRTSTSSLAPSPSRRKNSPTSTGSPARSVAWRRLARNCATVLICPGHSLEPKRASIALGALTPALRDQTKTWGTSSTGLSVLRCTSMTARTRWSPSILPRARPSSRCLGLLRKRTALAPEATARCRSAPSLSGVRGRSALSQPRPMGSNSQRPRSFAKRICGRW